MREEALEGLAEQGPPGRQGWGQPSHNPPPGGGTLRVGLMPPPHPRQPYQDNDCYCVPAADPAQTAPSCSSCRASGPL